MKRLLQDIVMILAFLIGLLGIIGLLALPLCQGLSYAKIRMISSTIRFPLGEVEDLAVDNDDNVIVYSRDHCRLQIYRNNGDLLRGWFVYTSLITTRIHIDPNNNIHLATMGDEHYVFDTYGNLLSKLKDKGIFEKLHQMDTPEKTLDSKGNVYKIFQTFLRTHIFKITPEGSKAIVISDPTYVWLFRWMLPTVFFCVVCSLVLVCLSPRYGILPDNWISKSLKKALLLRDVKIR